MRTFTKRTVVLLAAGTFALASLGVLATQPTSTGMWGHDMNNPIDSGYGRHDSHMSNYNWFGRWRDRGNDRYMMDADCRHDMDWHSNRSRNRALPPAGQNHRGGRGSF